MTDHTELRWLLGDKYDDVIDRAAIAVALHRHPIERTPKLLVRLASALYITGELACIEREVEQALAAVLPDLLAEARAEVEQLTAAIDRVRELHQQCMCEVCGDDPSCEACDSMSYPCATIRALEGPS